MVFLFFFFENIQGELELPIQDKFEISHIFFLAIKRQ
jgi:hypothetical protein